MLFTRCVDALLFYPDCCGLATGVRKICVSEQAKTLILLQLRLLFLCLEIRSPRDTQRDTSKLVENEEPVPLPCRRDKGRSR